MQTHKPDLILIDDSVSTHMRWSISANALGWRLSIALHDSALATDGLDRDVPIYVDLRLGCDESGIDAAGRLYAKGFRNLYLATGEPPDFMPKELPYIKDVVGKRFPLGPNPDLQTRSERRA